MSIIKNTGNQYVYAPLVSSADGSAITSGATFAIAKDGGPLAIPTGALFHKGSGLWEYQFQQADTNANNIGYVFGGTNVIPQGGTIVTVDYPRTAIPAIAAGSTNGLPLIGQFPLGYLDEHVSSGLKPTIQGRTLDVSVNGNGGIDWGNIDNQSTTVDLSNTHVSGVEHVYFSQVKYVKDTTNTRDEYSAQWYKNDQPVPSSSLTNPAISVFNTNTGAALFQNQTMTFASVNLGVVRYNDTSFLTASGEPYLVVVSGTIDSSTRVWRQVVGLDIY